MRITFVLPSITLNGGIRVVALYANGLKQRGHQVKVVAPPLYVPMRRKIKSLALGRGWPKARWEGTYFATGGIRPKILESFRPVVDADLPEADVVVATSWHTAYWVNGLSPSSGAKAILIQNYEVPEGASNPELDATWRMPFHKIVISKWLSEFAREKFGDTHVSLVPYGIDFEQFNAPPRRKQEVPTVGLLYSKEWFKGCGVSLAALKSVASTLPNLRLVSFGAVRPGPIKLRLPTYAEFHFQPAQEKLKELYAQCDVWMCASNREGFHMPPMEAMACRCPVVSTRVGGPIDMIEEGVNGYLVERGDAAALADRVLRVLNLPQEEWKKMSDKANATARRYIWSEATALLEKALEVAVERNRAQEFRGEAALGLK